MDTIDGEGGRDKGHSRGQIPCSPPVAELLFFLVSSFFLSLSLCFSLVERPRDHSVSRRCRFDDSRGSYGLHHKAEGLISGPTQRGTSCHATFFFFFFFFSLFLDRSIEPSLGARWSCGSRSRLSRCLFSTRCTKYCCLNGRGDQNTAAFLRSTTRLSIKRRSIVHGFNRRPRESSPIEAPPPPPSCETRAVRNRTNARESEGRKATLCIFTHFAVADLQISLLFAVLTVSRSRSAIFSPHNDNVNVKN